jgi:TerB-C domain
MDLSIVDVTGAGEPISFSHAGNEGFAADRLGDEYEKQLNLTGQQVDILNLLWYPSNNFSSIPFCRLQLVKLFVLILDDLAYKYQKQGTAIEVEFNTIADLMTRSRFKTGLNDYSYKHTMLSSLTDIYHNIFKHAENALRVHYGHTRKINTDVYISDEDVLAEYHGRITDKLAQVLMIWIPRVDMPDRKTERLLYAQSPGRWRQAFEHISRDFKSNIPRYMDLVMDLAELNSENPSLEMIYYEASKDISAVNPQAALTLYIHYIYADLLSDTFDNRPLNKANIKKLFKTDEQLHDFQVVVKNLIASRDITQALAAVSTLLLPKRKKISLNADAIEVIKQRHSGTVELLNKYLQEDEEPAVAGELPPAAAKPEPVPLTTQVAGEIFSDELNLSALQSEILIHFNKSNFAVPQSEMEEMAKERGAFKNQLIDSINEACFDMIDDVLIEEEEENYVIYEQYYQNILAK